MLILIQDKVGSEIEKLMKQVHILRLDNRTSKRFVAQVVIAARKDDSVKLAMDAKPTVDKIFQNEFQSQTFLDY